jgi:hypothetical protein
MNDGSCDYKTLRRYMLDYKCMYIYRDFIMTLPCRRKPVGFPDEPCSLSASQTLSQRHKIKTLYVYTVHTYVLESLSVKWLWRVKQQVNSKVGLLRVRALVAGSDASLQSGRTIARKLA